MAKISATATAILFSLLSLLATVTSRCFARGFVTKQPPAASVATSTLLRHRPTSTAFVLSILRGGGETTTTTTSSSSLLQATTKTTATAEVKEEEDVATTKPIPSWESLESELEHLRSSSGEEKQKPVLTLYRDTNGWCPFCERVWIAIAAKGLPYQETLVNLQNKPEWYKQMVPTTLVPAVLFHGDNDTKRELVWESDAILEALDEKFPNTPKLVRAGDQEYEKALDMQNRLQSAGFKFTYGNRNGTLTEAEIQENRDDFDACLDELDAALGEQQASENGNNKCFRLGSEFSGIDAIMAPTLERWRYQLPITADFDILANNNRKHLKKWFDTMDSYDAYGGRVAGDEYSWTATASIFLRYFEGGEDKPDVAAGIARADAKAEQLAESFVEAGVDEGGVASAAALEAATKLIANHEAVLADCFREEPLSQQHFPRAQGEGSARDAADLLLRRVASSLLEQAEQRGKEHRKEILIVGSSGGDNEDDDSTTTAEEAALALRTISKRLCVPRDMGARAAAVLRSRLTKVAEAAEKISAVSS